MAGGPKCLSHALLGARQDVAAGSHGATNQNRLTSQLIVKKKWKLKYLSLNVISMQKH